MSLTAKEAAVRDLYLAGRIVGEWRQREVLRRRQVDAGRFTILRSF